MKHLLSAVILTLGIAVAQAQEDKPPEPATKTIYQDKSWTHIGNGNFSPESDGASDLTVKSAGESLGIAVKLDEKMIAEAKHARWKSLELSGEVIGNDTGNFDCSATVVKINDKKIGEINKSGHFRIAFDKSHLLNAKEKSLTIQIVSGNSAGDTDDQELGQFVLSLSEREAPKPPPEEKPADEPKPANE